MATYIATLQFIVATVTSVVRGKNAKTKIGERNANAPKFTAMPYFPSDQRWRGSGSPRRRFRNTHPIEMIYADNRDVMVSEMTAFSATCDPMLIIDSSTVMTRDTITELRGMFQPGVTWWLLVNIAESAPLVSGATEGPEQERTWLTYAKKDEQGSPSSRANDQSWRDAVATSVIVLAVSVTTSTAVMAFVAAMLPVVL
jgi:hypothetical protein